jgi:hypothetical protein
MKTLTKDGIFFIELTFKYSFRSLLVFRTYNEYKAETIDFISSLVTASGGVAVEAEKGGR